MFVSSCSLGRIGTLTFQRFRLHYGRWVAFDESMPTRELLVYTRQFPLLLCSICLVAVRQANQQLASTLAPVLFNEAKDLLLASLLVFPQRLEFFQASLILSLWSTTIGQVPLSLDSWLLSGYTLQQASANPAFAAVHSSSPLGDRDQLRNQYIWTHLCLAHLQSVMSKTKRASMRLTWTYYRYCVGTRRKSLLNQKEVDDCDKVLEHEETPQFETRMVAEVKLYWIIYSQCCAPRVNLGSIRAALSAWKRNWHSLFGTYRLRRHLDPPLSDDPKPQTSRDHSSYEWVIISPSFSRNAARCSLVHCRCEARP